MISDEDWSRAIADVVSSGGIVEEGPMTILEEAEHWIATHDCGHPTAEGIIRRLMHFLKLRDRQHIQLRDGWVRAAEKALEGDPRELRLRVEMAKAPPVEVVLSADGSHNEPRRANFV